jgi:integrase
MNAGPTIPAPRSPAQQRRKPNAPTAFVPPRGGRHLRNAFPFGTTNSDTIASYMTYIAPEDDVLKELAQLDQLREASLVRGLRPQDATMVRSLALRALAPSTLLAYRNCWDIASAFHERHGLATMPMAPDSVAFFVAHCHYEGYAPKTLRRFLSVIRQAHRYARQPDPTSDIAVRMVMKGAENDYDGASFQKEAVLVEHLEGMIACARQDRNPRRGLRDAAFLLFSWACALRMDDSQHARVEHVRIAGDVLTLWIPKSKTDQAGRGAEIFVHRTGTPLCAVTMLERWMRQLPSPSGPLFRKVSKDGRVGGGAASDSTMRRIVKDRAAEAGFSLDVSGHSLRIGWATAAFEAGVSDFEIMKHLRHACIETSVGYNRSRRRPNLTRMVGL